MSKARMFRGRPVVDFAPALVTSRRLPKMPNH